MELKSWKGNVLLLFKQTHLKYPELLHTLYAKRENKNLTTKNPELIEQIIFITLKKQMLINRKLIKI